ncbi:MULTISPECIES: hypothetical protein [unclassified Streptomyces]
MSLHRKWTRAPVASRRLVDQIRSDSARRRREDGLALATPKPQASSH